MRQFLLRKAIPLLAASLLLIGSLWAGQAESTPLPSRALTMKASSSPRIRTGATLEEGPWVILSVRNSGGRALYFDRRYRNHAIRITVFDAQGKLVPLNNRGIQLADRSLPQNALPTSWTLPVVSPLEIEVALADYVELEWQRQYTVQFDWELEIYDRPFGRHNRPPLTERVLLKTEPLKVVRERRNEQP